MPQPRWLYFLLHGRWPVADIPEVVPMSPAEFEDWKQEKQRQFIAEEAKVHETVEMTSAIMDNVRSQIKRPETPQE